MAGVLPSSRASRRWSTPATLRTLRRVLHIELAGVALLILMAAMMARGVWMVE